MANDPADALAIELAKRRAARGIKVLDVIFASHNFDPYDTRHGAEVARQARALEQTDRCGPNDLATLVTGVLGHFGYPYDPGEIRATVRQHFEARP